MRASHSAGWVETLDAIASGYRRHRNKVLAENENVRATINGDATSTKRGEYRAGAFRGTSSCRSLEWKRLQRQPQCH